MAASGGCGRSTACGAADVGRAAGRGGCGLWLRASGYTAADHDGEVAVLAVRAVMAGRRRRRGLEDKVEGSWTRWWCGHEMEEALAEEVMAGPSVTSRRRRRSWSQGSGEEEGLVEEIWGGALVLGRRRGRRRWLRVNGGGEVD